MDRGRVVSPVFVGRAPGLRHVEEVLSEAALGDPAVVLVAGEAGVARHAEWARMGRETSGSAGMTGGACGVVVAGDRVGTTEWERPARLKFAA